MNVAHAVPVVFDYEGDPLVGVCNVPAVTPSHGVLVLVGGPQYRVGSHRQFALLARVFSQRGIAAMRFDFCGMGDSDGPDRGFRGHGGEICAAIDEFVRVVPSLSNVVLWGLCDGASAALLYATGDKRVSGIVLLNPWVRSEAGLAKTRLKHYYLARLFDRGFWHKLARGGVDLARASGGLLDVVRRGWGGAPAPASSFQTHMAQGWRSFAGPILLVLSGADLTAKEFLIHTQSDPAWAGLLGEARVVRRDLVEADHTFSRAAWRNRVVDWCAEWMAEWIH